MKKILSLIFICFCFLFVGCNNESHFDKAIFTNINGKWLINDGPEYIEFYQDDQIFEMNDWEIFGDFMIDSNNPSKIFVTYEDLNFETHSHYMYIVDYVGTKESMWVEDVPMHQGERVLLTK